VRGGGYRGDETMQLDHQNKQHGRTITKVRMFGLALSVEIFARGLSRHNFEAIGGDD